MVHLEMYDALGREVATLKDADEPTGLYDIEFESNALPSGMYFCRLRAGEVQETIKLLLVR